MCSKNHDTEGFECYHQEVWTATQEVSMPFTSPSFADDMMYAKTMSYTFLSLNLSIFYRVVKDIADTFYASLRLYPNGLKAIVLCLQV